MESYIPSKVVCLFLVQFDVKVGYKLVWSKSTKEDFLTDTTSSNIEYKVLPSGLQEVSSSTILISHEYKGKLYFGLSQFHQNEDELQVATGGAGVDRTQVKMFALGVICDNEQDSWKPNEFLHVGWEYGLLLKDKLLALFASTDDDGSGALNDANKSLLEQLYLTLTTTGDTSVSNNSYESQYHPLKQLPQYFRILGPLVYQVYKQALLRKKILVVNHHHENMNYTICAFNYIISLCSVIPFDVQAQLKQTIEKYTKGDPASARTINAEFYSTPLYNIGLHDIPSLPHHPGYIALTNDEMMMYQRGVFDILVYLDQEYPKIILCDAISNMTLPGASQYLKASHHEYEDYLAVFQHINSGSVLEPQLWWSQDATQSIGWQEYIWSAFSWFASAGQEQPGNEQYCPLMKDSEDGDAVEEREEGDADADADTESIDDDAQDATATTDVPEPAEINTGSSGSTGTTLVGEPMEPPHLIPLNDLSIVDLIGRFHKRTRRLFYYINEIVMETIEYQLQGDDVGSYDANNTLHQLNSRVVIELTYQDVHEAGFDPYMALELEFLRQFVLLYWEPLVLDVEIGLGVQGICC
ncbi:uncharacterized protein KQ657_003245 [Scheffersomyces spartinae]|uniref:DUF4484 domain-containing protein n=1 Tax=Scheffersomyces spartinae TaxID=45513 RepID=A0A9P8AK37_9ASCO|nr:uncharacterized protein KQ657_003245 [Scheffersomyces spartinae]KAG7195482.1 hypothetical protein KQ657_003245 [Scheffersomyces spartinae]